MEKGAYRPSISNASLKTALFWLLLPQLTLRKSGTRWHYTTGSSRTVDCCRSMRIRGAGIGPGESLYIVTGCIKSESWALAAYKGPMVPPNDTLRLVQVNEDMEADGTWYAWTERGTSEARSSEPSEHGLKNQSLFLRGFKLTFSPRFYASLRGDGDSAPSPLDRRIFGTVLVHRTRMVEVRMTMASTVPLNPAAMGSEKAVAEVRMPPDGCPIGATANP
ncbi:hypothetical protein FA13DRAFT_1080271 [Coprinellus micaceus]|uniref:Uncharacterized protein n=1 Tax=Coprinellus micaceus TaxID=71717 RepID=A0A4Y7TRB2_COPMI|nr:hypothetical protein FA13DRAFT_1080271 [Coprinellus micaceus]